MEKRRIFISYARANRATAMELRDGLALGSNSVWIDSELRGGQEWWERILEEIRRCDVLLFLLDDASLGSDACTKERDYAMALNRPVLPVRHAGSGELEGLPTSVSRLQVVDYDREAGARSLLPLWHAMDTLPVAEPLPDPLPDPPARPVEALGSIADRVSSSDPLGRAEQEDLLERLLAIEPDPRRGGGARKLIRDLMDRSDIEESVALRCAEVLGVEWRRDAGLSLEVTTRHRDRGALFCALVAVAIFAVATVVRNLGSSGSASFLPPLEMMQVHAFTVGAALGGTMAATRRGPTWFVIAALVLVTGPYGVINNLVGAELPRDAAFVLQFVFVVAIPSLVALAAPPLIEKTLDQKDIQALLGVRTAPPRSDVTWREIAATMAAATLGAYVLFDVAIFVLSGSEPKTGEPVNVWSVRQSLGDVFRPAEVVVALLFAWANFGVAVAWCRRRLLGLDRWWASGALLTLLWSVCGCAIGVAFAGVGKDIGSWQVMQELDMAAPVTIAAGGVMTVLVLWRTRVVHPGVRRLRFSGLWLACCSCSRRGFRPHFPASSSMGCCASPPARPPVWVSTRSCAGARTPTRAKPPLSSTDAFSGTHSTARRPSQARSRISAALSRPPRTPGGTPLRHKQGTRLRSRRWSDDRLERSARQDSY